MPSESSVSSDRSFLRRLTSDDVVPRRVEARNHPGEQALDAVHARPFPARVIADLQDVELAPVRAAATGRRRSARAAARGADDPRRHADGDRAGRHGLAHDRAGADDRAVADRRRRRGSSRRRRARRPRRSATPARHAALLEHRPRRIAEVVVAADHVAVGGEQRVRVRSRTRLAEKISQLNPMLAPSSSVDVAVLARQDGVAADEHAAADA